MKPKQMQFLLLAVLTAGEAAGSYLRMLYPESRVWTLAFVTHGIGLTEGNFRSILQEALMYPLLWLALFAVIGLTVCAAPAALTLVFLHGLTLGEVLTGLYQRHALTGFLTAVTFVMPYALLQTLLLLTAARESLRSSLSLKRAVSGRAGESCSLRAYLLRFLILGAGLAVLAVIQGFFGSWLFPVVIRRLVY